MYRSIVSAFLMVVCLIIVGCQTPEQKAAEYDKIFNEGVALTNKGELAAAIPYYRKAVRILPDDPKIADAYNNLGWSLQETGDLKGAAAAYEKALQLRPDYTLARNNLRAVQRRIGEEQGTPKASGPQ